MDRKLAVAVALGTACVIGGVFLVLEFRKSEAAPAPGGPSSFLAMVGNGSVNRVVRLLSDNGIPVTFLSASRATQFQVAEAHLRKATELLSEDALEGGYVVSFSGDLGQREPKRSAAADRKPLSELLKSAEAGAGTPLGDVLRHPAVTGAAATLPVVAEWEHLTFDPDPASGRVHVFHFFRIRLVDAQEKGNSRLFCYQVQEAGWPLRISERAYEAVRKTGTR